MPHSKKSITYHGRAGHPKVHRTKRGRKYIMVRKPGGGVKRLYQGTKYLIHKRAKALKRLAV